MTTPERPRKIAATARLDTPHRQTKAEKLKTARLVQAWRQQADKKDRR